MVPMVACAALTACSDDDDDVSPTSDEQLQDVVAQYVDHVVVPTYSSLADEAMTLYEACSALRESKTQANVESAAAAWIAARKYWELSEAFLYGAAADYSIDPHIDSWPLDKSALDLTLKNSTLIAQFDADGCNASGFSTLGFTLLGFHAVEYVIFRDGAPRLVDGGTDTDGVAYKALTDDEVIYCKAVAEDLRNQCIRLEASWAGTDALTQAKQEILADAELEPSTNYGDLLKSAGQPGNVKYKTVKSALEEMLQGMSDISDEVGNTKITDPVSSGNVLDVESWYSWNSITDFADNMRGVRNAYYGQTTGKVHDSSLSAVVRAVNADLESRLRESLDKAVEAIEAMPAPFRNHLTVAETAEAKAACNEVFANIESAIEALNE